MKSVDAKSPRSERSTSDWDTRKDGVDTVERALSILDAFSREDSTLTLAEVAKRTSLHKSTIIRFVASLERCGYLNVMEDGRYQIGQKPLSLANIYQHSVQPADLIMPVLQDLVKRTSESASFYVARGDVRVCLYRVDSPRAVRDHVRVGDILGLSLGASGKAILAFLDGKGAPYDDIRRDWVAVTFAERDPDTAGVACPVFGAGNALAGSLSLSGLRTRFDPATVQSMTIALLESAARICLALGGDPEGYVSRLAIKKRQMK